VINPPLSPRVVNMNKDTVGEDMVIQRMLMSCPVAGVWATRKNAPNKNRQHISFTIIDEHIDSLLVQ